MTSHDVRNMYKNKKIDKLYKQNEKYFNLVDSWADKFVDGDLLTEYELKFAQQQLNGAQVKLNPIAGAFEALMVEYENDYFLQEEKKFAKVRTQDKDHCKAVARKKVSDIRTYASDFTRYVSSAQNAVITVQSLLKRQTIMKSNKEIDFTGDISNAHEILGSQPLAAWDNNITN